MIPPSPSASACTAHTTAIVIAPSHGPSSATASVPPSRWPCVPTVTGNIGASPTRKKAPRQAGDGQVALAPLGRGAAQAHGEPGDGHHAAERGGLAAQEAVRDVHARP